MSERTSAMTVTEDCRKDAALTLPSQDHTLTRPPSPSLQQGDGSRQTAELSCRQDHEPLHSTRAQGTWAPPEGDPRHGDPPPLTRAVTGWKDVTPWWLTQEQLGIPRDQHLSGSPKPLTCEGLGRAAYVAIQTGHKNHSRNLPLLSNLARWHRCKHSTFTHWFPSWWNLFALIHRKGQCWHPCPNLWTCFLNCPEWFATSLWTFLICHLPWSIEVQEL